MAFLNSASHNLNQLKGKLINIFSEDADGLCDEVDSLGLITKENYILLHDAKSPVEKVNKIINILKEDELACKKLLEHLENMIPRFPALCFLQNKRRDFQEILVQLKMENHMNSKLTLGTILEIGQESLQEIKLQRVQDGPWYFLHNLMALNVKARNLEPEESNMDTEINVMSFDKNNSDAGSCLVHPLDVQCILLHCSDNFLQQEIVSKMATCQFAFPILLPSADGPDCTFMIWAMRDIVKRWRPLSLKETKGFMEDNLVNISLPFYSFVRLENCSLSKSVIINQLLTPSQQHIDYFLHRDMEGGDLPRKISDGLVEMSCFFPSGKEISDIFTDPLAVLNLRGDILSNWTQFSFLTQISSAVFIFADIISEAEYQLLSSLHTPRTKYFTILTQNEKSTVEYIKNLYPVLNLDDTHIIVKGPRVNDAKLVKHVQKVMKDLIHYYPLKLEQIINTASELGIHVDEKSKECQTAKDRALEITGNIQDVATYKKETLKLQGDLWKQLAKTEKELCRMKLQTDQDYGEHYRAKLIKKRKKLLEEQNQHSPPPGIVTFIDAIIQSNPQEKHFFLKWLKILLDSTSRVNLSELQSEYKIKCNEQSINLIKMKELDQRISESSLGIEHFLRELAQFYEAECFMVNDGKISERQFCKLPEIASDLLLDGFPLELIDGDASNIPLQWITDVLKQVDMKMKCQCRMRVITVLGVQSTGKSTLLNTMFGLQFPVASGRCTRGAFMTLIKVKENFQKILGCQFILIIDTEGLKAPELASLKDSYEHDNELATLVIGLSDITIINMAMENTTEMKDVLQIVVHAFLRMETAGKKPNCQFVHQNVGDVSAYEKNMRDRKKFSEQLNEMTQIAARMEKKTGVTSFSDVMDHDLEKHTWYIPGLWHGVPPMASVNSGYSENINQLKKHLLDFFNKSNNPQRLCDFSKWIGSLWNAVKHENFIFNFRNSLVAEAYEKLSSRYNDLQWNFSKVMYNWIMETENMIQNKAANSSQEDLCNKLQHDLNVKVDKEETTMRELLEKYFEDGSENASLIERYREEFFTSVKLLRKEQENKLSSRIEELVQIQKGKNAVEGIEGDFNKIIDEKVTSLLNKHKNNKVNLDNKEVKSQFEEMWNDTLSSLKLSRIHERNIEKDLLRQLKKDMSHSVGAVTEKLAKIHSLNDFKHKDFKAAEVHVENSFWKVGATFIKIFKVQDFMDYQNLYVSLLGKCNSYVTEKVNLKADYHETYCQELLKMIREELHNSDLKKLHTTPMFELDVKLHILGKLAPLLQMMHHDFIQENDPNLSLEEHKGKYLSTFQNIFNEKDDCQNRAKDFCDICLKPALIKFIDKNLGTEIVDDILQGENSTTYRSRKFFQFTLLKKLLKDNDFKQYVDYINNYEMFVKNWITQYIKDKYKQNKDIEKLQSKILTLIMNVVVKALNDLKLQNCLNVQEFLKTFCEMLNKDLVISSNDLKVIEFKNTASVCQFSGDIKRFLTDTEEQITREMRSLIIEDVLSRLTLNPQDELFTRVFGCGKWCPFCKVPCEAGGKNHTEHSAEVHRPIGLGGYRSSETEILSHNICSTNVHGNGRFRYLYTDEVYHPYKDYRKFYPDWAIQADPTITASDYWKFILMKFNDQFAKEYNAKPAEFPEDWKEITQQKAMESLEELYNMKEYIEG